MPLPLFDWETPVLPSPRTVRAIRDRQMAKAAQHAEDVRPSFLADARAYVLRYLELHGPTSGEVLTVACKQAGIVPPGDRAFGAVYMGLVRRGLIVKVGECRRMRGHGSAGANVWARSSQ